MAELSRRRVRLVVVGVAAAAVVAGGTGVGLAVVGPSSSTAAPSSAPAPAPSGSGSAAPTRPPREPHLAGTVSSTSSGRILIKDFDGFTRTIRTSSATKYQDGLTATPATGTRIVAAGTVDADGTSLDATSVGKLPDSGPGPRGGPGHGFGGPGWGGPRGTRPQPPSGAPSGAPSAAPSTSASTSLRTS